MADKSKYKLIYIPDHPDAMSNGCVLEHRLIAEEKLGRRLSKNEIVHHIDEDKSNNHPDNLEVLTSRSEHAKLHKPAKPKIECKICKTKTSNKAYCSPKCYRIGSRKTEWPTKEILEKELSKTSFCALGRKYGVSDNAIRKWAKAYNLI